MKLRIVFLAITLFAMLCSCGKEESSPISPPDDIIPPAPSYNTADLQGEWFGDAKNSTAEIGIGLAFKPDGALSGTGSSFDSNFNLTYYDIRSTWSMNAEGKITGSGTLSFVSGTNLIVASASLSLQLRPNKCEMDGIIDVAYPNLHDLAIDMNSELDGVSFANTRKAVAVGLNGKILQTEYSGATWTGRTSGTTNDLDAVSFADANTGIAVGQSGTILRMTDGGTTWNDFLYDKWRSVLADAMNYDKWLCHERSRTFTPASL
jgi:hypothetical protein